MRASAARLGMIGAVAALLGLGGADAGAADQLGSASAGAADRLGSASAGAADRLGSASAGGPAPIEQSLCGKPGQPACPMQKWMRVNVASPLADNDTAALATGLEKAAKLVPDPAWGSWVTQAMDGAAAAKKGDIAGARASCKSCHDAWRDAYRAKYRLRPIPR